MKVLMTGGGTAGHINPALAIADTIRQAYPDAEFLFVGAYGRMEMQLVPQAGYPIRGQHVRGFQRRLSLKNIGRNVLAAVDVVTASSAADKILREFQPDLAIGTGGYVCGPVLRRALKRKIPVLVHESNAFPGVTVKMLAKEGATVLLCSEDARKYLPEGSRAIVTGNPLRQGFQAPEREKSRQELALDSRPMVLSFGGSLGAKPINTAMTEVLQKSHESGALQHIHGTGKRDYAATAAALEAAGVPLQGDGIRVREYIDDMPRCMAAADLVVCRCGAMTLSELPAMGKPAILIPSPYVAENHQYHNAMALVRRGAAECIEEKELTGDKLWETIKQLTADPVRLAEMAENMRKAAILDADERILAVVRETLHR